MFSRFAAALTIAGAGAHVLLAVLLMGRSFFAAVLLGAMAGWCLHCGTHLWRDGTAQAWRRAALGGMGMIGLHIAMMAAAPSGSVGGHQHSGAAHEPMVALDGLMTTAMAVGIVAELLLIFGVLIIVVHSKARTGNQCCDFTEITTVTALSRSGAAVARRQPGQRPQPT